jgi:hypothetical protein
MNSHYAIINQQADVSKNDGSPYVKLTIVGIQTRETFTTYIDLNNHNVDNWMDIIMNPNSGFVVHGLKTTVKNGKTLINADSKPIIDVEADIVTLLSELKYTKPVKTTNNFNRLFPGDNNE